MALDDKGHSKGFAFVEFAESRSAHSALTANNYELKSRRIAVTLADPRVRAKHKCVLLPPAMAAPNSPPPFLDTTRRVWAAKRA